MQTSGIETTKVMDQFTSWVALWTEWKERMLKSTVRRTAVHNSDHYASLVKRVTVPKSCTIWYGRSIITEFSSFISDFSYQIRNRKQTLAACKSIGILRKRDGKYLCSWKQFLLSSFFSPFTSADIEILPLISVDFESGSLSSLSFEKQLYWL